MVEIWSDAGKLHEYCDNAGNHAGELFDGEKNYHRLLEIYEDICSKANEKISGQETALPKVAFVSNYINHHQIPFCEAMYEFLKGRFVFVQTCPMEQERVSMGWQEKENLPYVLRYYENPLQCKRIIKEAEAVLFGGEDEENYLLDRLQAKKPVIRYSERIYKEGQWKAVSPRGLLKKYRDHTRYRKAPVYLLCAGAYVPSDFHIVRAYPDKMLKWGYFPETIHYDVDRLMAAKKPATILWAARFLNWKHPETAVQCAAFLKQKGIPFQMKIVGDGEKRPLVESLMEQYGLSEQVTLLGYCTPEKVRRLMEETDIYLATSDRREGWGAVINEAMNSGCAVVADHMMGAAPYLIRHGVNGFVYADGRPKMLFETVERLLKNRDLCRQVGREAVKTIETEWNAATAAGRLLCFCIDAGMLDKEDLQEDFPEKQIQFGTPKTGPVSKAEVISERKMICTLL